jgi:hypothetical protein
MLDEIMSKIKVGREKMVQWQADHLGALGYEVNMNTAKALTLFAGLGAAGGCSSEEVTILNGIEGTYQTGINETTNIDEQGNGYRVTIQKKDGEGNVEYTHELFTDETMTEIREAYELTTGADGKQVKRKLLNSVDDPLHYEVKQDLARILPKIQNGVRGEITDKINGMGGTYSGTVTTTDQNGNPTIYSPNKDGSVMVFKYNGKDKAPGVKIVTKGNGDVNIQNNEYNLKSETTIKSEVDVISPGGPQ